jgi:hypothetical protein
LAIRYLESALSKGHIRIVVNDDTNAPVRTQEQLDLVPLSHLPRETGLSLSTWRRALTSPIDPLPHVRVGLGDPRHARILVRRGDLEAWIARRNAAATPKRIVEEIVAKALRS